MTSVALTPAPVTTLDVDALIVGITNEGKKRLEGPPALPDDVRAALEKALEALGATGKLGEITKVPGTGLVKARMIVAVGLGDERILDFDKVRRTAGAALRSLAGTKSVAIVVTDPDAARIEAVTQGALLGNYAFHSFRGASAASQLEPVQKIVITGDPKDKDQAAALTRAEVIAEAVNFARDLVNTPPSALPPEEIAQQAIDAVRKLPVGVEVWDEDALARDEFGGILAVGQGSANPPRLIRLEYSPKGAKRTLAIVGKGVTFDSGGLSLKPPKAMETMKCDMSGAAAVIAAVAAIARLKLKVNVIGWIPTVENMPGGRAQRPGDVITIFGGRTVEVLNTDAEGRLILADALVAASDEEPALIIDAATLTGAQTVALGDRTSGIMANDDDLRAAIYDTATRAGETMWHMPIPEESRGTLDSAIADIKNIGDGKGGMLSAAAFLREFVPDNQPWAHLDIAGPAFNEGGPYGYTPKGGTGAAVRTFIQAAEDVADGRLP
ncbi:MAG: leucyl aminopeptidase [Candidatus Nanopelagicales bacterium]